jgi:hypothetical protein
MHRWNADYGFDWLYVDVDHLSALMQVAGSTVALRMTHFFGGVEEGGRAFARYPTLRR